VSRKPKNQGIGADAWIHNQRKGESRKTLKRRIARHRRQRSEKGYSWHDWIDFDTFLAGIIANGVRDFRLNGVGVPIGLDSNAAHVLSGSVEVWNEILLKIETPLRRWSEDKFEEDFDTNKITYAEVQDALRLLADHFGHLWD